jgi:hypothetical protein
MCITCNFCKAHQKSHKSNIGLIACGHTKPGQGVSSDDLEANTPGWSLTTKGQPSTTHYKYASFWVDHMSSFIYVTFHSSKAVKQQQNLNFCPVGAHWQNSIAKRFIGTITERAWTIFLHAMAKWPSIISEEMQPFTIHHAINFHNVSVRKDNTDCPSPVHW